MIRTATSPLAVVLVLAAASAESAETPKPPAPRAVTVSESTLTLPTYEEELPDVNPRFDLFARRPFLIYPYTTRTNLTDRRAPKTLAHARARERVPEAGACCPTWEAASTAASTSRTARSSSTPTPRSSTPTSRIAGAWVALGVEFNFPVSHNWMTVSPVDFATVRHADGSGSIWVGNTDRPYGMHGASS